mmetsp:Transcript_60477/g.179197  ORF Transcript_60477/g.179197 Transcript_60477/m.179197 type:complete len:229 (-) Transcript_60477:593-1279(-)
MNRICVPWASAGAADVNLGVNLGEVPPEVGHQILGHGVGVPRHDGVVGDEALELGLHLLKLQPREVLRHYVSAVPVTSSVIPPLLGGPLLPRLGEDAVAGGPLDDGHVGAAVLERGGELARFGESVRRVVELLERDEDGGLARVHVARRVAAVNVLDGVALAVVAAEAVAHPEVDEPRPAVDLAVGVPLLVAVGPRAAAPVFPLCDIGPDGVCVVDAAERFHPGGGVI